MFWFVWNIVLVRSWYVLFPDYRITEHRGLEETLKGHLVQSTNMCNLLGPCICNLTLISVPISTNKVLGLLLAPCSADGRGAAECWSRDAELLWEHRSVQERWECWLGRGCQQREKYIISVQFSGVLPVEWQLNSMWVWEGPAVGAAQGRSPESQHGAGRRSGRGLWKGARLQLLDRGRSFRRV